MSSNGTSPKNTFGMLVLASPMPVMALLMLPIHWLQSTFCPESTIVSGHLDGFELALGAVLIGLGLLLIGVGLVAQTNTKFTVAKKRNMLSLAMAGGILVLFSFAIWLDDVFSYYCATPNVIVVHPDPFLPSVTYKWSDVQRVSTGCTFSRGGMSINFNLEMNDNRRIGLGGDSWSMLKRNYKGIGTLLSQVPYAYDNAEAERCPLSLQQLFSARPG
jgi:hypothetical protein